MRAEWDMLLSEIVGGTMDPDAPALANRIEACVRAIEADNARLRSALTQVVALEERPFDKFPADWSDQIKACPECERYKTHPIQQGICDTHRRPIWDREKHDAHERSILGIRMREVARDALAAREVCLAKATGDASNG